jgi:hypothetical protein
MANIKFREFLFIVFTGILSLSCHRKENCRSCGVTMVGKIDEIEFMLDSLRDGYPSFKGIMIINGVKYTVRAINDKGTLFTKIELINNLDTISFYETGIYLCDSIFDVNEDGCDDLNILYDATKGFVVESFLFDKKSKRLVNSVSKLWQSEKLFCK